MLVNCVVYQEGKKLADIAQSEIHGYLSKPGCFVWVALRDTSDAELEEMSAQFGLHELSVEDARHGHQRPKIEEYGSEIYAVLHVVEVKGDELHVGEVNVFTGPNYVLSVRNRSEQGFLGVRARCEREPELLRHGSGYVLYALMDAVVDRYFPVLDAIETELEAIEDRDVRLDLPCQQPCEERTRAVALVCCQPFGPQRKAILDPLDHRLRGDDLLR